MYVLILKKVVGRSFHKSCHTVSGYQLPLIQRSYSYLQLYLLTKNFYSARIILTWTLEKTGVKVRREAVMRLHTSQGQECPKVSKYKFDKRNTLGENVQDLGQRFVIKCSSNRP
jgi:hypothetical protein